MSACRRREAEASGGRKNVPTFLLQFAILLRSLLFSIAAEMLIDDLLVRGVDIRCERLRRRAILAESQNQLTYGVRHLIALLIQHSRQARSYRVDDGVGRRCRFSRQDQRAVMSEE